MKRTLWIFDVRGGSPFSLCIPGSPPCMHDGGRSLLRFLCTEEEARGIREQVVSSGARIVVGHSPRETVEQKRERFALFGCWPTEKCPSCSWFDPAQPGLCGAGMNGEGTAVGDAKVSAKMTKDLAECPLANERG